MAPTQAICSSFKTDLLCARHNFLLSGGNTFKLALYTSSSTIGAATTAYTATNEVSGTGYTATGNTLTRIDPSLSGTTALTDFADTTWSTATITARGGLIYNDSATTPVADAAVMVLDFGTDKTATAGDFTIVFPAANVTDAIIRIA